MSADRYTVRLFERFSKRSETEVSLDAADDDRLREVLEERVKAHRGDLKCDLSQWRLDVERTSAPVHVVAKVSVDSSGRTVVKR